jgi:hypothetical protein
MRRIPSSVQGLLFGPILISLFFVLKAFCPGSAGDACFADQFAVPIFLPLIAVYKIFGSSSVIGGQEFLFIMVYWAIVGFVVGLIIDLVVGHKNKTLSELETNNSVPTLVTSLKPSQDFAPRLPKIITMPKAPEIAGKKVINLLDQPEYK